MGTPGLPWGQQSDTAQLLVPATGTVLGKGRTQQLLFTPSAQSSQEQSLEQPDPKPRVCREERSNSVLVALLQEVFLLPMATKGTSPLPWGTGTSQQPSTPWRTTWFYLGSVYWGAPGVRKAETTHQPSSSIYVSAKNPLLRVVFLLEVADQIWG